ncbi:outer membrane beta-barrel domain-containing protein [Pleionea litopenaei]|uniref:Outer membrane beta-barrel domain-containing protein n=1 Tax=Pleionea litopenaei TaxID=3070815 RepID=A0AA51RVG9_9GAMM|nr:outer membrane beta-barrel domain-containing protein [Pleionea sp. HL-JVS1]WMS88506.1 outer membrane beta-barrel domain-containing protein [Pleionea sp. HL-JVS1]
MDNWIQRIFLGIVISLSAFNLSAAEQDSDDPSKIFEPKIERQAVDEALIDDEDFEVGIVFGTLGIEDFGAAELYGVRFNYFINEDFFLQVNAGSAKAGLSSAEQLFPGNVLISNDKDFQYYDLNLGWNILPGEAFWGDEVAVNTSFYFVVGAGNTSFLDNKEFTLTYGAGYRALLNDWLAFSVDTRNHRFNSEYPVGEVKSTHNLEFSFTLSAFF